MCQLLEHNQAVNAAEVSTHERHQELTPLAKDAGTDEPVTIGHILGKSGSADTRMMNQRS